jgi:hypothetical protein
VTLSARDREILAFECSWWLDPGSKGDAIRREIGLSPSAYYRRLDVVIDEPEAYEADPLLVRRLWKKRAERRRTRHTGPGWNRTHP